MAEGERTVYSEAKLDFVTAPEVQARLTYGSDGVPIAILVKPKGDKGMALLQDWLRAMFKTVRGNDEVPS